MITLALGSTLVAALAPASPQGEAPCFELVQKLAPPDLMQGDQFGRDVALDGDTLAIGATGKGTDNIGGVYVFRNRASQWVQEACLSGSLTQPGESAGRVLAVSGDTLVMGLHRKQHIIWEEAGIVYVFWWNGTAWIEQALLTPPTVQCFGWFGYSVAIEGDVLVVGAPNIQMPEEEQGVVEVYRRTGTQWNHTATLTASDGARRDHFGDSVALEQNTLIVGAGGTNDACPADPDCESGAVYVFEWNGSDWTESAKLIASDGEKFDRLGESCAISGSLIVAGSKGASSINNPGAAYVFRKSGTEWIEEKKLEPNDGAIGSELFGLTVAAHDDTILVFSCSNDWQSCSGAVYAYRDEGGTWPLSMKMIAPNLTRTYGRSMAVQGDTICIGAPSENSLAPNAGAAYCYRVSDGDLAPTVYCTAKTNSCGTLPAMRIAGIPSATSGGGLFLSASATAAGKPGLLLYTDTGRANFPFQDGTLCVDPKNLSRGVPITDSQGTTGCDGELSIDMNAFAVGLLGGHPRPFLQVPGTPVNAQFWGRDSAAHGNLLTDAAEYSICP